MLVRFLSIAASVVGSARHRAILVSCLVLVASFTAILSISLMHGGPAAYLAGNPQTEDDESVDGQREPVWLNGRQHLEERTTQEPDTSRSSNDSGNSSNAPRSTDSQNASDGQPPADTPEPEISLSQASITLSAGSTSSDITARIAPASENISWSIVLSDTAAKDLTVINGETLEAATSFRIRAGADAKPGKYQFTIIATVNEVTLSRTLTVTVQ
jgi:hypothetical protein